MSRFNNFIKKNGSQKALPLLHTCDGYAFRDIVDHSALRKFPCKVFGGDELIYLFYGRPSYRTSLDHYSVSHPAFMPVVIMLSPDVIDKPKRIAPFDTGAFSAKLFAEHLHPDMKCEDFFLEPKMDMPGRLVSTFYQTNSNYYHSSPVSVSIPPLQFEAISYNSLITSRTRTSYDDRKESIEVQSGDDISLKSENVELVVLPNVFLDDHDLRVAITSDWDADYRTYPIHHGDPNEYIGLLYREVEEYLETNGYM